MKTPRQPRNMKLLGAMRAKGLTRRDLAVLANVHEHTIRNMINRSHRAQPVVLNAVATALGKSLVDLGLAPRPRKSTAKAQE